MPSYIVFSDRTLVAIATLRPSSAADLARIPGVGPKKLQEWGPAVLAVVAAAG
jgi:DNA helicase II / ATP-dependent DNA helicase PcrA